LRKRNKERTGFKSVVFFLISFFLFCDISLAEVNYYDSGMELLDNKKYYKAITAFEKHLDSNPGDSRTLNNIGFAYYKEDAREKAIKFYRLAVKADPGYAVAYNNLGIALYHGNDLDDALTCFKKAVVLNPEYAKAMINTGLVYLRRKDKKTAKYWYKRAKTVNKKYVRERRNSAEKKYREEKLHP